MEIFSEVEILPISRIDPSAEVINFDVRAVSILSVQKYKFPSVKHLKLSFIYFPEYKFPLVPLLFPNFDKIISLDLSSTDTRFSGAKSLATILKHMTSLKSLNLGWNFLTRQGFDELVPALETLRSLENLYFPKIHIEPLEVSHVLTVLTSIAQNISLLEVDLSFFDFRGVQDAALPALARFLRQTPNLRHLNLSLCHITDLTLLAPEIKKMKHLKRLDLSQNNFQSEGFKLLASNLAATLEELNIVKCGLDGEVLQDLGNIFQTLKCFTFGSFVSVFTAQKILNLLASLPDLHTLHLCNLSIPDLKPIGLEFQNFNGPIKVLGLKFLASTATMPDEFVIGLEHLASSIEELELNCNKLGPVETSKLAKALEKMVKLKRFSIGGNEIGPVGSKALGKAFENLENLEDLHFSGNRILDEGAEALAKGLSKSLKLRSIELSYNSLTTKGLCAFVPIFEKNGESLLKLGLSNNKLTLESLKVLKTTFGKLSKLHSLEIAANLFGDVENLFSGFEKLVSLRNLSVEETALGEMSLKSLVEVTEFLPSLRFLGVGQNPFIKHDDKPYRVLAPVYVKDDVVVDPSHVSMDRAAFKVRFILSSLKLHASCPLRVLPSELVRRIANSFMFDDDSFNHRNVYFV